MRLDDTYAYLANVLYTSYDIQLGGIIENIMTDETFMFKTNKCILCQILYTDI